MGQMHTNSTGQYSFELPVEMTEGHPCCATNGQDMWKKEIFPGVHLTTMCMTNKQQFIVDYVKSDRVLEFGFVLQGNTRCYLPKTSIDPIVVPANGSIAHFISNVPIRFEAVPSPCIQMLGIEIEESSLQTMLSSDPEKSKILDIIFSAGDSPFYRSTPLCPLRKFIASQIFSCPFRGTALNLFLQGKVLELMAYQFDLLLGEKKKPSQAATLTPSERESIHHARNLLLERMGDPPSLPELAKLAGIGINKLKSGFKTVFGKTAFACLHDDRMEKAYGLLLEHRMNVSQVAWTVGYTNVSHFSIAFHKRYGVKPKALQMQAGTTFGAAI